MTKKKVHHFVHDGYLKAWRMPKIIYVYDLQKRKSFEKTGRDVGAEGKFNVFSFDERVIDLLHYTFAERVNRGESNGVYRPMLCFIDFMKNFDYQHKTDNFLEDFYGYFETRIDEALRRVKRVEKLINNGIFEAFDSLIFFFCLQLFRTPKIRHLMSGEMMEIYHGNHQLDAQQKDEFIKMHLLISALAMAADIVRKGCQIRLNYADCGGRFINSDAPVILSGGAVRQLDEIKGRMPLSPHVLMEIDHIGLGARLECRSNISYVELRDINCQMIFNARRSIYFSSANQLTKYLPVIERRLRGDGQIY
ncbi:DUF4238 domain-containing protein [Azoarcus sp. KH32C]|uniref:DUF4238 domain-containing protein n=1 Tax=Azoarcus sp. KH32C TaxID=748247 RepID=UPI00155A5AA2|nr:DUF4238 domain-containing protein [Azoarcus sp. KH32C]